MLELDGDTVREKEPILLIRLLLSSSPSSSSRHISSTLQIWLAGCNWVFYPPPPPPARFITLCHIACDHGCYCSKSRDGQTDRQTDWLVGISASQKLVSSSSGTVMDEWKSLAMAPEQKAGEKEKEKNYKVYISVCLYGCSKKET